MKKISLLAIVALTATLTSCKKDRTCTCTFTPTTTTVTSGGTSFTTSGGTATTDVTTYKKVKKGQAAANCIGGKVTQTGSYGTITYSAEGTGDCKLS